MWSGAEGDLLGDPDPPLLIGQLRQLGGSTGRRFDSAKWAVAASTPHAAHVFAEGLRNTGDITHFEAAAARELGCRYAAAYFAQIGR